MMDKLDLIPLLNRFTSIYPSSEWGAGHVVLSDYNLDDDSIMLAIEAAISSGERTTADFLAHILAIAKMLQLPNGELVE
jgi:hypothetical protein